MRKRLATLALLVALGLAGTTVAKADAPPPTNGGNCLYTHLTLPTILRV
jgi:hypothetical protein